MAHIDIPCIADGLSHSIIYEEYKGDFAEAHNVAAQCLANARQKEDIPQQADALLASGIVSLLQGEPLAALRFFEDVSHLVPEDTARSYRAALYTNLAIYRQYNAFPNGSAAGASEISARWNGTEVVGQLEKRRTALQSGVSDPALLREGRLVNDILSIGLTSRTLVEELGNQTPQNAQELWATAIRPTYGFQQALQAEGNSPELFAFVTWMLADLCRRSRQVDAAWQLLDQASQVYTQIGDSAGMAICLMSKGDWLTAPYSNPMVWNFAIQSSNESSRLSWSIEQQEFSQTGSDIENGLAAYMQAGQLFEAAQAQRGLAAIELRKAYLAILRGDYRSAIEHAERAESLFQASGDYQGYRTAQIHRMLSKVSAGEVPEESDTAGEIGMWGATQGSFSFALGLGLMLGRAGRHWLIRVGDYERSLACYRLAETLYSKLGAETNRIQSLVDQGDVYQAIGDRTTALIFYEQSLDAHSANLALKPQLGQEVRDQALMLAVDVFNLYLQYMEADGMERSANRLRSFLTHYSIQKESPSGLASLISSGLSGLFADVSESTVSSLDKGISAVQSWALTNLGWSTLSQANVLIPLYRAVHARNLDNTADAEQGFAEAEQAALQADRPDRLLHQCSILAHQKKYAQATEVFKQYLAAEAKNSGFTGSLVDIMAAVAGERGQAESRRKAENDLELAVIFFTRCKAYSDAHQSLEALIQSAGPDWWRRNSRAWLSLADCGEIYEGLEQWEQALGFYTQAIGELEQRRTQLSRDDLKTALAGDKGTQYLYFMAARAACKIVLRARQEGNKHQELAFKARMFEYAELGKARALLDLMASSIALTTTATVGSSSLNVSMHTWRQITTQLSLHRGLLAQERNRKSDGPDTNRINRLEQQIQSDETALRAVEKELAKTNPDFYRLINPQTPVLSLEKVSAALPPNTALLQYFFLGEEFLAWAITSQGMTEVHIDSLDVKAFERQIGKFHLACEQNRSVDKLSKELVKILLEPLSNTINAGQHLLIVPYSTAHLLPFHALPWKDRPLSESHSIRYLPSASILQFMANHRTTRLDSILAIGNPANMSLPGADGSSTSAPSLPWAAIEASYVGSLFEKGKVLTGATATEEAFRQHLEGHQILHLATHGYLSVDSPLASSILFADGQDLTVYELMGLQLNGQIVVLSACQTAQGEVTGGDDVLGLTRGLLGAGARAAVVSLWPVNDLSTSLLMGEFYRKLLSGASPDVALQAAQNYLRTLSPDAIHIETDRLRGALQATRASSTTLQLIEEVQTRHIRLANSVPVATDYSHPYYWAPFILVG
jgi:CHAT domain-containing protein